jgi:ABC-2 type transport system permease protein
VLIAPLLYAFFLGSIYLNKDIDNISFAIVDYDKSPSSRKIYQYINSTQKVNVVGYLENYDDAVSKLKDLKIEGFLFFNEGFEKRLLDGEQQSVNLYLNTTRFLPSNDLNKTINDIFLEVAAEARMLFYEKAGIPHAEAQKLMDPVKTTLYPIYNTTNSYGGFLLPGLFFLILQQTLLIGLGESTARDNKNGLLNSDLVNNISSYFLGKSTYYYLLYISYLVFFMVVVFPFFNLNAPVEYLSIVTVFILFITAVMLLAILFGTLIKSQIRIMEVLAFTSYPFFLLSGYSWPIDSMPLFLQWLSWLIPTTPLMQAVTKLLVMHGNIADVMGQIVHLLVLILLYIVLLLWRVMTYKMRGVKEFAG